MILPYTQSLVTLRQALVAPKDKLSSDEKQEVIYLVRCQGCNGEYVRETERKLSTRMREHKASVSKGTEKSSLSTHNLRTGHTKQDFHVMTIWVHCGEN